MLLKTFSNIPRTMTRTEFRTKHRKCRCILRKRAHRDSWGWCVDPKKSVLEAVNWIETFGPKPTNDYVWENVETQLRVWERVIKLYAPSC